MRPRNHTSRDDRGIATVPNCLTRTLAQLDTGDIAAFEVDMITVVVSADARGLLEQLQTRAEPEIAAVWSSLGDACNQSAMSFEIEAERLLQTAIISLDEVTWRRARKASEVRRQNEAVRNAARNLVEALVQHDKYYALPSGLLWEMADALFRHARLSEPDVAPDLEEAPLLKNRPTVLQLLEQVANNRTKLQPGEKLAIGSDELDITHKLEKAILLENGPTMLRLVEQLADLAEEALRAPRKEPKAKRAGARVTRFREHILVHLLNRLGANCAKQIEAVAHGITLAAFYGSKSQADEIHQDAARMQLTRLLAPE